MTANYPRLIDTYLNVPAADDVGIVAQHIVEQLIADDVFGRLNRLRDELTDRLNDGERDRQMACEHALDVLTDLLPGC
jgi:hypothetical protein